MPAVLIPPLSESCTNVSERDMNDQTVSLADCVVWPFPVIGGERRPDSHDHNLHSESTICTLIPSQNMAKIHLEAIQKYAK